MSGRDSSFVEERAPEREAAGAEVESAPESQGPDEQTLGRILAEVRSVGRDLLDLLHVGFDRARLGLRGGGFRLLVLAWLALAGATATIVAAYFVVDGLAGLLARALGGDLRAGRLAAGVVVLVASGVALRIRRGRARKAELRRLEAKYAARTPPGDRGDLG